MRLLKNAVGKFKGTKQERVLKGINYRIKVLKECLKICVEADIASVVRDYEHRLDEVESLKQYIKEVYADKRSRKTNSDGKKMGKKV